MTRVKYNPAPLEVQAISLLISRELIKPVACTLYLKELPLDSWFSTERNVIFLFETGDTIYCQEREGTGYYSMFSSKQWTRWYTDSWQFRNITLE